MLHSAASVEFENGRVDVYVPYMESSCRIACVSHATYPSVREPLAAESPREAKKRSVACRRDRCLPQCRRRGLH